MLALVDVMLPMAICQHQQEQADGVMTAAKCHCYWAYWSTANHRGIRQVLAHHKKVMWLHYRRTTGSVCHRGTAPDVLCQVFNSSRPVVFIDSITSQFVFRDTPVVSVFCLLYYISKNNVW